MAPIDTNPNVELGAWTGANLRETALQNVGLGVDADLPATLRFKSGVAKLVKRRITTSTDIQRPAVFLLEPTARTHRSDVAPKSVPMLDNGLTPIAGRLWFVNEAVVFGKYVDLEEMTDDILFEIVTKTLQLGEVPAIVFDPRTPVPTVRHYPTGLNSPNYVELVEISTSDVTLARILEVIQQIHSNCFVTPDAQAAVAKLWEDGTKWWPVLEAELRIQAQLRPGLVGAFPTCTVRQEQTGVSGRYDLEIEERDVLDSNKFRRWAILELKVLRSFGSTGIPVSPQQTREWVEEGVRQAASYRSERGALASALCCFDMRKVFSADGCFQHVCELATILKVELRVYFLFATSKQYRQRITAVPPSMAASKKEELPVSTNDSSGGNDADNLDKME